MTLWWLGTCTEVGCQGEAEDLHMYDQSQWLWEKVEGY